MALQEGCAVVYLRVDDKPGFFFGVLLELCEVNHPIHTLLLHIHLDFRLRLKNLLTRLPLAPVAIIQVTTRLLHPFHPAPGSSGISRVLKEQLAIFFRDRHSEPRVIHHTQNRPVHVFWLETQSLVHSTDEKRVTVCKIRDGNIKGPERPAETGLAPGHVDASAVETAFEVTVFVLGVFDVCEAPCWLR